MKNTPDSSKPHILVTNDDGLEAPGIHALAAALKELGDVTIVAPQEEQSGAGHSLTLKRPLRYEQRGPGTYRVDGTPTDCVHLAVYQIEKQQHRFPSLVVSGINRGYNLGDDVTYSGTVAGALEGTLLGIPSLAVSSDTPDDGEPDYDRVAKYASQLARKVLEQGLPTGTLLNMNVPLQPNGSWCITTQGTRSYRAAMQEGTDPGGKPYFWISDPDHDVIEELGSDYAAMDANCISVTPILTNFTDRSFIEKLEQWKLGAST